MMLKWFNDSNSAVTFANAQSARIQYVSDEVVPLGTRVMYSVEPNWWGYVGKVIAVVTQHMNRELIVQYDTSASGFPTQMDAYAYFDKIL